MENVHEFKYLGSTFSGQQRAWLRVEEVRAGTVEWMEKSVRNNLGQRSSSKIEMKDLQEGSETSNVVWLEVSELKMLKEDS